MVGKDRKAKQIDPKISGELVKVFFDPNLSVIKILPLDRIIADQEASYDGRIVDVSDSNLTGVTDFSPR